MSFDDHPADRQSYSHAGGFRGEEGIEDTLEVFSVDACSRVFERYQYPICFDDSGSHLQ